MHLLKERRKFMARLERQHSLKIVLIYSPAPRQVREWLLDLDLGTTVLQALEACHFFEEFSDLEPEQLAVGIWGRKTTLNGVLMNADRLEIYRGLRVDPKVARRERFNVQGTKSAGLFAKRRLGAKAGY